MRVKMDRITTEKLIKLVRRHPELYDEKHKDYGDFPQRETIWQNISKQMGIRGEICKAKWNVLRGSYRRAQRYRESGLADWSKAWRYEDQLSFLKHCLRPQKSIKKSPTLSSAATPEATSSIHIIKQEPLMEEEVECEDTKLFEQQPLSRSNSSMGDLMVDDNNLHGMSVDRGEEDGGGDPIKQFFLALAETVKTLPLLTQVTVKRDVFNVVHEAEVKMLQQLNDSL